MIGSWVLSYNQQQNKGSELQAGIRAEMIDSPLTRALSTFRGRISVRTAKLMFFGSIAPILNYSAIRPFAAMQAIRLALQDIGAQGATVVDPAAGYSTAFYWLAEEFPQTQFIEIDTEAVIKDKEHMLRGFTMPENLTLRVGDLSNRSLEEIVTHQIDVLVGIGAYVSHEQYLNFLSYSESLLNPGGYVVAAFPYLPGIENFQSNKSLFTRLVNTPKGVIRDVDQLQALFAKSHFDLKHVIQLSDYAAAKNEPIPADVEIFAVARHDG